MRPHAASLSLSVFQVLVTFVLFHQNVHSRLESCKWSLLRLIEGGSKRDDNLGVSSEKSEKWIKMFDCVMKKVEVLPRSINVNDIKQCCKRSKKKMGRCGKKVKQFLACVLDNQWHFHIGPQFRHPVVSQNMPLFPSPYPTQYPASPPYPSLLSYSSFPLFPPQQHPSSSQIPAPPPYPSSSPFPSASAIYSSRAVNHLQQHFPNPSASPYLSSSFPSTSASYSSRAMKHLQLNQQSSNYPSIDRFFMGAGQNINSVSPYAFPYTNGHQMSGFGAVGMGMGPGIGYGFPPGPGFAPPFGINMPPGNPPIGGDPNSIKGSK